ncbi:4-hydroxy-3-methylbut-2-enyl diphosphate reductase [bacterium]|nr:4-hydroxy-3-methylbut-2-enyl diphosphate reductase [Flavobacteriales bacterium]MDA9303915.1 4-hydroxy-3-methylbut-2-enyl diphosphate reductase [bacterium]MDB4052232.1 4-hydroxy-3-methylbut-2-enyl diphosphate reductase [Flavobacteriales bacterium]
MKRFDIPAQYKSGIIGEIKEKRRLADRMKKDFSPSVLEFDKVDFVLARHFGFCFGVENAVEKVYAVLDQYPEKNIYLLSQMIHNPNVNADLQERGIKFIMDTNGTQLITWDTITSDDIVLIPAFGTTLEIEAILKSKNITGKAFDTTCPFVEKVWNRSEKLGEDDYTIIVHGKASHEETRATFSHSSANGKTIIVKNMDEAKLLAKFIDKQLPEKDFYTFFEGKYSEGFNPFEDLQKVGVVNQTTMLASETHAISQYFKDKMTEIHGEEDIKNHFADTRDTLCYATNDNQSATLELMKEEGDFAVIVGGYNSSNTMHLVELLEQKFDSFFVQNATRIESKTCINHFDIHENVEKTTDFISKFEDKKLRVIITCGASCPDSVLNEVIEKIVTLTND